MDLVCPQAHHALSRHLMSPPPPLPFSIAPLARARSQYLCGASALGRVSMHTCACVSLSAPGDVPYFPAAQSVHVAAADEVAPSWPCLPAAHKEPEQEDAPDPAYLPAGHDVHAYDPPPFFPAPGLNFPATQAGGESD